MSDTTIDDLAHVVKNGFDQAAKENDDLARMVKNGFDDAQKRMDKRFDRLEKDNEAAHAALRADIAAIHSEIDSIHGDISLIWKELKAINKRLDELIHWIMSFQRKLESSSGFRIKYGMTD